MRLILVQNMLYVPTLGGANKANRALIEGLARAGHDCRALVPSTGSHGPGDRQAFLEALAVRGLEVLSSSPGVDVFRSAGVEVHAITERGLTRPYLVEQIRELEPDWVLVSSEDPGQEMLEVALEVTPRVVYIVHTPLHMPFGSHSFSPSERKTALIRKCAGILTVSRYVKDYIRRWGGMDSEVIPFPVYGDGPWRHLADFDQGCMTLVNPCDFKGLPIFLDLARSLPEVPFAAVPTWGTTAADRASLEELPNVTLLPPADDIDEIFARTRVLLMPSLWTEAFPLLPVEAMLRGIPVLASNVEGLAEAKLGVDPILPVTPIDRYEDRFDDRKNPIAVVPPQDAGPWREALLNLIGDRQRYEDLSRVSRDTAQAWVARLSIDPFERFLDGLTPREPEASAAVPRGVDHEAVVQDLARRPREAKTLLALRALQAKRQNAGRGAERAQENAGIPRREVRDRAPLSFEQERLWFLDQIDPGSSAYNELGAVRLLGDLDPSALESAIGAIVERHDALRTTFTTEDGVPVAVIEPAGRFRLSRVDLGSFGGEALAMAHRLVADEVKTPFDLQSGPLLRAVLYRLAADDHALAIVVHHIVSDGWSLGVFVSELAALYPALAAGRPPLLPELPVQYGDYAAWQRSWMSGKRLDDQVAYWTQQLRGAPGLLDLPTDRPRPAVPSGRGARRLLSYPEALATRVREIGDRANATPFMVLLAAFQTLLCRHTGQDDIVLGTDVANRQRSELEPLIGFFVNQLVLRIDLSGNPAFDELLARVRRMALDAYGHQSVPFAKVVEAVQPERDLGRTPLFQAMFALQNAPASDLDLAGLALRPFEVDKESAKFDLVVLLVESGEGLGGLVEYSTDLFDGTTLGRLLDQYGRVLEAAVAEPGRRIQDLPLLSKAERHQLVVEWNDSGLATGLLFPELFAEQSRLTPDAVAVVCEGDRLTYRGLAERARSLAAALAEHGAAPDKVVALLSRRGIDLLTAVIAILETGAAYLPLDPDHPPRRVRQILESSGATLVVVSADLRELLSQTLFEVSGKACPQVLGLDQELSRERPSSLLRRPVNATPATPEDIAYVIYTSGSTGAPKGAMVEHRGMVNHLWAKVHELGLSSADTVAQNASQCFDISVWQLLVPLIVGARVQIVPDDQAHDPASLLDLVEGDGISVLETVPSLLRLMIEEAERRDGVRPALGRLRWLIPTGEALPPDLCRRWLDLYPDVPLLNAYGPTECSDDVTHRRIDAPPFRGAASVPIGRPLANLRLYILDRRLRPTPVGVAGEICVGGEGVGRGYLGDPGRTASAFLPDPFAESAGARMYQTGDQGRWLADGEIEFLGRIDHQVKVRGFRIELGEIEAALVAHPGVQQAVALAREEGGHTRLVAYVVQDPSAALSGPESADAGVESEKVEQWRTVFDEVYRQGSAARQDEAVNLRVWVDSYTGEPLPEPEVLECVEDSVSRILRLRPQRVLEIGCGTGLLLMRIAPSCRSYWGTDLSGEVLATLADRVAARRQDLHDVRLFERAADDLRDIPEKHFDVVVLNEVVQYFPSADYLLRVIDAALARVRPGGFLFVGGVRNRNLFEAFHASIQLHQAPDALPVNELRRRIRSHMAREKELLVAPEFWQEVRRQQPRITSLRLDLKGGRARNELTRFRYDVTMEVEGSNEVSAPVDWLDWRKEEPGLDGLRRRLDAAAETLVGVAGVPNARLRREVGLTALLRDGARSDTAAALNTELNTEINTELEAASADPGVDPHDLWSLAAGLGLDAEIRWSDLGADAFDAVFRPAGGPPWPEAPGPLARPHRPQPWAHFANNPLQGLFSERLVPRLRADLAERLPDYMVPSSFVLLDAMPLTPNGKIDRRALPAPEEERPELNQAFVAPRSTVEETLAALWAQVLRLDHVGVHDNFFELGGDSILSIQIVARANQQGLRLTPRQMFQHQTIAELAAVAGAVPGKETESAEQGPVEGEALLTPAQRWFFERSLPEPHHYNMAVFFSVHELLDPMRLERATAGLLLHHDALRLRYPLGAGGRRQLHSAPGGPVPFHSIDLAALAPSFHASAIEAAVSQAQQSLDLERGPLLRVVQLGAGPGREGRLLIAVHHLAVDGVSWGILLEDFKSAYDQAAREGEIRLPAKTVSFRRWSELLSERALLPELVPDVDFWLSQSLTTASLPRDLPGQGPGTEASARQVTVGLGAEATRALLQLAPEVFQTRINDVLLTALVEAFAAWTGERRLRVDLETHGRDAVPDVDVTRTVGWFTADFPVLLEVDDDAGLVEALQSVKEQLRRIPNGGASYGLLRYCGNRDTAEALRRLPPAEIAFNYLGQVDGEGAEASPVFSDAAEDKGATQSPSGLRSHLLQIDCSVVGGRFRADWTYSEQCHRHATVEWIARELIATLEALATHCRAAAVRPGFAPHVDPGLSQSDLERMFEQIDGTR